MIRRFVVAAALIVASAPAFAQQRPLQTEDPETIGAGRLLVEAGLDYNRDTYFPVSGLRGNHLTMPDFGVSLGVSSIAEIQIDWGIYQTLAITERIPGAPLTHLLQIDGDSTDDFGDIHVGAKVRLVGESGNRPAIGSWFSTRLPNAGNESGLGKDVQDFSTAVSVGKTIQSVRVVANIGMMMIGKPTDAKRREPTESEDEGPVSSLRQHHGRRRRGDRSRTLRATRGERSAGRGRGWRRCCDRLLSAGRRLDSEQWQKKNKK